MIRDPVSISGRVILKTFKVRIMFKCSHTAKGVAPSGTPRFRIY